MSTKHDESQTDLIRAKDVSTVDIWSLPSFDPYVPRPSRNLCPSLRKWRRCRWMRSSQ